MTTEANDGGDLRARGRAGTVAGLAVGAAALALIMLVPQLRHCVGLALHGHFSALRSYIQSLGAGGLALLLGLMITHAVVFYPSEIVTATAGYVYGFLPAVGFVICGWLLTALCSYALGLSIGGPLLRMILGARYARVEASMNRGGTRLLLAGRLIPVVPFALLGYAAGATGVSVWRFSWTTVVGYLPLTIAVAYLGSRARTLTLSDPLVWIAVAALVLLIAAHWLRSRRSGGHVGGRGRPA